MFEKTGKFYADWRDANGHRLRKSFASKRAALQFEAQQKELANPKPKARGQACVHYSAPATSNTAIPTRNKQQKPSSPKPAPCRRPNSAPPTSRTSTRP